jgi:alkylated DNA repair protein (DNA oxidative demethylase)
MRLPDGAEHYSDALDADFQRDLIDWIESLQAATPFYRPTMPRSGRPFTVEMTNAGVLGWVSDKSGYRYQPTHPFTGERWGPIPSSVIGIWERYARFPAPPEACLVNRYRGTAKLGSHVDADEAETRAAVVSISLGDDAVFHVGGPKRTDPKAKITLRSGDVLVLGGASRLAYHGIDRVLTGTSDVVPGGGRINLTLRRVTRLAGID